MGQTFSLPITLQDVQKGRSPERSRFGGARSSKAAGPLARGAYTGVREHDNRAENTAGGLFSTSCWVRNDGERHHIMHHRWLQYTCPPFLAYVIGDGIIRPG